MPDADDTPAVRACRFLVDEHAATLERILAVADAVATEWPSLTDGRRATADRSQVVPPFEAALERTGLRDQLPTLLAGAVDAAGYQLPAPPVPAPPYVAVSGTGPVLRATVDDGRLVLGIDCFDVIREPTWAADAPTSTRAVAYVRSATTPSEALSVRFVR